MITHIGSQSREPLAESGYTLVELANETATIADATDGHWEYWYACDDFAGYVIDIDGIGYEYGRDAYEGPVSHHDNERKEL